MKPIVRIVGLGPAREDLVTPKTTALLKGAAVARLRTATHPAASAFADIQSFDHLYESAESFESLYETIAQHVAELAKTSPSGEVVYAVPGSPIVAERTVELLQERDDVHVILESAVSVIDVSCAAMGIDPMSAGLRILDALDSVEPFRGPGPLLILQTYSPEVLAGVSDRLPEGARVTVLHHLGLEDERVVEIESHRLASFSDADHLTSLWVENLRTAGDAFDDLVAVTHRLRAECPWDQEQTHASLTKHLVEESYEALDALEALVAANESEALLDAPIADVEEELGDLLFQILFHAELGAEEEWFSATSIIETVMEKLIFRHPHVFGDVTVSDSKEVEQRWEQLKKEEKGRTSVLDGIPWQMPALALARKVLNRAKDLAEVPSVDEAQMQGINALSNDALQWGSFLLLASKRANEHGVDLEDALRQAIFVLRAGILTAETKAI